MIEDESGGDFLFAKFFAKKLACKVAIYFKIRYNVI